MRILACTLTEVNVSSKYIPQATMNDIHTKTDCKKKRKEKENESFRKYLLENVLALEFI